MAISEQQAIEEAEEMVEDTSENRLKAAFTASVACDMAGVRNVEKA